VERGEVDDDGRAPLALERVEEETRRPGARERPGSGVAGTGGTAVSSSIGGGERSAGPAMRCSEVNL
jgi:hypothetical protein